MRLAIMQPYFLPYAGYFRLMCGVDHFVVFDNVQFPRRGWVHRNRLLSSSGDLAWLTLPLARAESGTFISALGFHPNARSLWSDRLARFPACSRSRGSAQRIASEMKTLDGRPVDYLVRLLRATATELGLNVPFTMSNALNLPNSSGRSERIFAICEKLDATIYVNAPGGRTLYDPSEFARRGIRLELLPDYRGNTASILQRLHEEPALAIRREIEANLI